VTVRLTAAVLLAASLAGCGGKSHKPPAATPRPAGGYLASADLERQMGNAFRKGLYRLAVMSQKSEDAVDLGQPLPTGIVRGVDCGAQAAAPRDGQPWAWDCRVAWKTVDGRAQRTSYVVRLWPGKCFAAGATPQRKPLYDVTIRTYAEDPLNGLTGASRGC
jgi:hypothetical protein